MATALVRRRVERLIALSDVVRAHGSLTAVRAAELAGLAGAARRHAHRWMLRLEALGIVRKRGERDQARWIATALGRDRRRALLRIGETGALAAVPHGACASGRRRAPRSDGEAMARLVADRAFYGHPAMLMVSNGAGDPLGDDRDDWSEW